MSEVQNCLLPLAKRIAAICDAHNIQYSLEGGSLLGAVRHQGFIPWDNDFDFFMTRENYDKFSEVAERELGDDCVVYSYTKNNTYPFAFLKIAIKNKPIAYFDQSFSFPTMLHIDVFPFDYVPQSKLRRLIQKYKAIYYKRMLIIHDGGRPAKSASKSEKILFAAVKPFGKLYTHQKLVAKAEKNLRKYAKTDKMALMMGVYGYEKTMLSSTQLNEYAPLKFEDAEFLCIKDYDCYLSNLYGDYMQLPPEDKRVGHDFELIDS